MSLRVFILSYVRTSSSLVLYEYSAPDARTYILSPAFWQYVALWYDGYSTQSPTPALAVKAISIEKSAIKRLIIVFFQVITKFQGCAVAVAYAVLHIPAHLCKTLGKPFWNKHWVVSEP